MDFIHTSSCLKRVNQPRRIAFMSLPCSRGRAPRTDHEEWSGEPLRFNMQIRDEEQFTMLGIPPKFVEEIKECLTMKLPCVVRLSVKKWCEF
ncbi:Protein transport protein Sec31A [Hordeum vulgare]|nr:Protein transport protein Sec31A [Hordeum vulgare]